MSGRKEGGADFDPHTHIDYVRSCIFVADIGVLVRTGEWHDLKI